MKSYSVKSIRKEFKEKGIFYTQQELALYMKKLLPDNVDCIYDPTCGNGGLLSVFDDSVEKYGQDINEEQLEQAKERLINFHGAAGDTLKNPAFRDKKFDYIIANPPFSIKWEPFEDERFCASVLPPPSKADYAFILHILHYLSDKGKAVVLNFPGVCYRGQREGKIRQWIIEQNYIEKVIHIAGGKFEDTAIATVIIVFNKKKKNTDILFVDDEKQKERLVPFEEVKNNDFNLSVSTYIIDDTPKEQINPIELEDLAYKGLLEKIKSELIFDKIVCEFEGIDFQEHLNGIYSLLDEFKVNNDTKNTDD